MRTILLGICICIASSLCAQRECATSQYIDHLRSTDPAFTIKTEEAENFISRQRAARGFGEGANVIRIPVVVHVLYKTAAENISDAQIKSQIDALNRDFRKKNNDTTNTPARFKALAADVQIEFVLATADPSGRATTGIVRKATAVSEWKVDDKIKFAGQGGDNAWDAASYLNIWVGNLGRLLGYSSYIGGAADKDGLVINYTAFGTTNVNGPYDLGRTTVHEAGHWLGLKHIWGDTYCGDDMVDDTPKQGNFTSGCPTTFRSSCSNGTQGDMYMNYMDYTNDACLNMFTEGQKQRMLALFNSGGPRQSLLNSRGSDAPWNHSELPVEAPPVAEVIKTFKLYPNPAASEIILNFDHNTTWVGKTVSIINLNGTIVSRIQVTSKLQKVNVSSLRAGMYFIQGENGEEKLREKFVKL